MQPLRQLFDEQGNARRDKGAAKQVTLEKALLHGASHIWIWRRCNGRLELLWQRRAATKQTWPNLLDIPAAGHIDLGEEPLTAALREAKEELDLVFAPQDLWLFGVYRCYLEVDQSGLVENEFQWLYLAEYAGDALSLQAEEVGSVLWQPLDQCKTQLADSMQSRNYVPHGPVYFAMLFEALDRLTTSQAVPGQTNHHEG